MNEKKSAHPCVYTSIQDRASPGLDASICNPFKLLSLGIVPSHLLTIHLGQERDAGTSLQDKIRVRGYAFRSPQALLSPIHAAECSRNPRALIRFSKTARLSAEAVPRTFLSQGSAGSRVDFEVVEGVKVTSGGGSER